MTSLTSLYETPGWVHGGSVTLQVCAILANAPIVYIIWRKRLYRIPSTRFVLSLCLSHLCVSLLTLLDTPPLQLIGQEVIFPASLTVWLASLFTVTLIALERFVTIARPMECKTIVTRKRTFLAILTGWLVSFIVVGVVPVLTFDLKGSNVRWYYGPVLGLVVIGCLTLMTLCYSHIFAIAREKVQKNRVKLGEFRRASISSEFPTSVAHSHHPPKRGLSSHSLLQRVLHQAHGNSSSSSSSKNNTPTSSVKSNISIQYERRGGVQMEMEEVNLLKGPKGQKGGKLRGRRKKWKAYLKHSYNSPKKTVVTILTLIGSVVLTSVPQIVALLLLPDWFPSVHALLFPVSSICHPLLYGVLNRNIRHQLFRKKEEFGRVRAWSLRRRRLSNQVQVQVARGKRKVSGLSGQMQEDVRRLCKGYQGQGQGQYQGRRGSLTINLVQRARSLSREIEEISNEEFPSEGNASSVQAQVEIPVEEPEAPLEEIFQMEEIEGFFEFPRKTSKDSGADMSFDSESEEDEESDDRRLPEILVQVPVVQVQRTSFSANVGMTVSKSDSNIMSTTSGQLNWTSFLEREGGGGRGRNSVFLLPSRVMISSISADANLNRILLPDWHYNELL